MTSLMHLTQFIVAMSVLWVWIMKQEVVVADFEKFRLSRPIRTTVGLTKVVLSLMMLYAIWNPVMVIPSAAGMAFMMIAAQYYHSQFDSPINKRLPSLVLLLLCILMLV